jgi:hypothetical protein
MWVLGMIHYRRKIKLISEDLEKIKQLPNIFWYFFFQTKILYYNNLLIQVLHFQFSNISTNNTAWGRDGKYVLVRPTLRFRTSLFPSSV